MTEIGRNTTVFVGRICIPARLIAYQFKYTNVTFSIVTYRIFQCPLQQIETKLDRIFTNCFCHFVEKRLIGYRIKIGAGCPECSNGNVRVNCPTFGKIIIQCTSWKPVGMQRALRDAPHSDMKADKILICVQGGTV